MTPSERLIARLRDAGIDLPDGTRVQRTYAGAQQRNAGAWSWWLLGPDNQDLGIGSQWPVSVLLRRGFVVHRPLPGEHYTDVHIDPVGA